MAQWAAFVGLMGVLVFSMLALARLSSRAVTEGGATIDGRGARATGGLDARDGDPRLPRFEPRRRYLHRTAGETRDQADLLSTGTLLLNVALTQGIFGVVVLGGILYFEVPRSAIGFGGGLTGLPAVGVGVAVGLGLWIASEVVGGLADAAGAGYDEALRGMLAPDSAVGWVLLLGAILPIVAFVEELLFRGAAIGAVVAGFGTPVWAIALVSSLAFGAAHGAQGRVGMALATALGLALAGAFVATGSLVVVIVAHYLVNAMEFVVHEGLGIDGLD